ncbi:hypothetical protein F2P56_034462, partial [Juglans regia]
ILAFCQNKPLVLLVSLHTFSTTHSFTSQMAAVGELFLSATLQVLFDRLASPELLQFARQKKLRKQLNKWKKTLTGIRKVLDDAEEKQHIDRSVKDWLDDLRDLAYDVEDILDEAATEVALRRTLMSESQASTSKIVDCMTWVKMKKGKEFCQCNILRNELNWDGSKD